MTVLASSCQACRKRSLSLHIPIRKLHLVLHASSSSWSSSLTSSLFKMAAVTVSIAFRDITASWSSICLLPASAQTVTYGEGSLDRLETVLPSSGNPPDSIGTTSPGIWLTSHFDPSWGRPLVCLLPSSSFSKIPLSVKVIRSSQHLTHSLIEHSWVDWKGFSQDLGIIVWVTIESGALQEEEEGLGLDDYQSSSHPNQPFPRAITHHDSSLGQDLTRPPSPRSTCLIPQIDPFARIWPSLSMVSVSCDCNISVVVSSRGRSSSVAAAFRDVIAISHCRLLWRHRHQSMSSSVTSSPSIIIGEKLFLASLLHMASSCVSLRHIHGVFSPCSRAGSFQSCRNSRKFWPPNHCLLQIFGTGYYGCFRFG